MSETIEVIGRTFKIVCLYVDDGCSVSETTLGKWISITGWTTNIWVR
jgi:hypothetical protein